MTPAIQWWGTNLNFSGVWKANLERSKPLGPTPKAVLARINHSDPELVVEMPITDGTEDRLRFRCLTTGEEVFLVGFFVLRSFLV